MPVTYPSTLIADAYFMRRLALTRKLWAELPASVQFDMARLPLEEQQLEDVVSAFGGQQEQGFGFAGLLEELMTAQPKRIPVSDIQQLQQNLKEQGYLPPEYEPTGTWDRDSYIAFSRMDRDSYEQMRSGKAFPSTPLESGLRMITNTLPSRVWQGLVGIAKGTVEQTVETAERMGALGGAIGGGATGLAWAGPAGVIPGAIVGGVTGFIADLINREEGEPTGLMAFVDALTPYEEYKGNPKAFWEDLGYFGTLASLGAGAALGAARVQGGITGFRAAQALPEVKSTTAALLTRTSTSLEQAAGLPTTVANMIYRRGLATGSTGWLYDTAQMIRAHSLTGRPLFNMINGVYTGATVATIGGRIAAGFDFGTGALGKKPTTIEKAIAEAPLLGPKGPELGEVESYSELFTNPKFWLMPEYWIDLTAFVIQPTAFFPFGLKRIGSAMQKLMSNTDLLPIIHSIQHNSNVSFREAARIARDVVFGGAEGKALYTYRWLDHAINREAAFITTKGGLAEGSPAEFARTKARLNERILEEGAANGGRSETAIDLLTKAREHPTLFEAELIRANGVGSGLEEMPKWREAIDYIHKLEGDLKDVMYVEMPNGYMMRVSTFPTSIEEQLGEQLGGFGQLALRQYAPPEGPTVPTAKGVLTEELPLPEGGGTMLRPKEVTVPLGKKLGWDKYRANITKKQIARMDDQIKKLEALKKRGVRPDIAGRVEVEIEAWKIQRDAAREELKALKREAGSKPRTVEDLRLGLMRIEHWDRVDFMREAAWWKGTRKRLLQAQDQGRTANAQMIRTEMNDWLDDTAAKGYLRPSTVERAKGAADPGTQVSRELTAQARVAARRFADIPLQHATYLAQRGYKAVWTGLDMLYPQDMKTIVGLLDIPEYNKVAGFIETIGMSPRIHLDDDLWALRRSYEVGELNEVIAKLQKQHGLAVPFANGDEMLYYISQYMRKHNQAGVIHGPLVFEGHGKGVHMYRVDSRQLTPNDILNAFEGKIKGIDLPAAQEIHAALRRGAAWGGEFMPVKHPVMAGRHLGRAMRLNGLAGFADLIRTWHTKEPFEMAPSRIWKGRGRYTPDVALARSVERSRVMHEMGILGAKLNWKDHHFQMFEFTLDTEYHVLHSMDPEAWPTPDSFYKGLNLEYYKDYAQVEGSPGGFFERKWNTPSIQRLVKLAESNAWANDWYAASGDAVRAIYSGAKVTLRNGRAVDADDLMMQILAITSGGTGPKANITGAHKALMIAFEHPNFRHADIHAGTTIRLAGKEVNAGYQRYGASTYGLIDELLDGKLMSDPQYAERWAKYTPFYKALFGDPDQIILDRRGIVMLGFNPNNVSKSDRAFMEQVIIEGAKRCGLKNAQFQARIWGGFVDHFDSMARQARKAGNMELADEFQKLADGVRRDPEASETYAYFYGTAAYPLALEQPAVSPAAVEAGAPGFGRSQAEGRRLAKLLKELGESKARDAQGNLVPFYHGTSDVFWRMEEDASRHPGVAAWFCDSKHVASEWSIAEGWLLPWAGPTEGYIQHTGLFRPNVRGAFLDIRNPFDRDAPVPPRVLDVLVDSASRRLDEFIELYDVEGIDELGGVLEELYAAGRRGGAFLGGGGQESWSELYGTINEYDFLSKLWERQRVGKAVFGYDVLPDPTYMSEFTITGLSEAGYDGIKMSTDVHTFHNAYDHETGSPPTIPGAFVDERTAEALSDHINWLPFSDAQIHEGFVLGTDVGQMIEDYGPRLPHLANIIEGQVRGMAEFGPDFTAVLRAFQGGDFRTMIHESAHLIRQFMAPEALVKIEELFGVRPIADVMSDFTPTRVLDQADEHLTAMFREAKENGGFTFDPHTNTFYEGGGFGVATTPAGSQEASQVFTLPLDASPEQFNEMVADLKKVYAKQFENPRVHIGAWTEEGMVYIDPSEVVPDFLEAQKLAALRDQKAIYDFRGLVNGNPRADSRSIHISETEIKGVKRGWTHEQEEKFADLLTDALMGTYVADTGLQSSVRRSLGVLYHKLRPWAVNGGYIPNDARALYDQIPEFKQAMKDIGYSAPRVNLLSRRTLAGAAIGATEGAITGDDRGDILKGAGYGALGGFILNKALRHTYGYLPDSLARLNTALRYTFSFTFDLGRYSEQNSIAFMKYGIPPTLRPRSHVMAREWRSPFSNETVTGSEAWDHALRFWDELMGGGMLHNIDDADRRLFQAGIVGFSPRYFEAAQAMHLYQRGMSPADIKEAISWIGRYGPGRGGWEKTMNFVFFPFSFSKKLLSTCGDFILQAPGRNLLLHEGLRRYHASQLDEGFRDLVENHMPALQQLWMVNNLAFGISPGRWFLEGLTDNRTKVGQASQIMASFFIPSGAATPLAKAAGGLGDLSLQAFVPIVVTGESMSRAGGVDSLDDIVRRYIPMVREIGTYAEAASEQWTAAVDPSHSSPWSQFQEYSESLKALQGEYAPIAMALGYSDPTDFLSTPMGQLIAPDYQQERFALEQEYPTGYQMTMEFENSAGIDAHALKELSAKPNKSTGEEAFLDLMETIKSYQYMVKTGVLPSEVADMIVGQQVRAYAVPRVADQRFAELYDRFLMRDYGPIRRVA